MTMNIRPKDDLQEICWSYCLKKQMATQQQIDDLLNDEWGEESSRITSSKGGIKKELVPPGSQQNRAANNRIQQSNSYANDEFEDYEESRRVDSVQQSQSQSQSVSMPSRNKAKEKQKQKERKLSKQLTAIKQQTQPQPKKQDQLKPQPQHQGYIRPALQLPSQSALTKKNKNVSATTQPLGEKNHLPHNYARLQERQKQLLLTTLTEENKRLKANLLEKDNAYKKLEQKYKMLGEQKSENTSTAKEIALEKQVSMLRTKLEQMANLNKISQERQKYKAKLSKNPGPFIPEEEVSKREAQLLDLIDKLKARLVESDQNLSVLHKKINQSSEHNDELHRKMRRVEQLEYKLEKMSQQAQTDRSYIDLLKQKIKQLESQLDSQKSQSRKLELEIKRAEMGQLTHADIVKELKEVRKEKEMLEKSLREMSATMMGNVRKGYQKQNGNGNRIEDSGELLRVDRGID